MTPLKTLFALLSPPFLSSHLLLAAAELTPVVTNPRQVALREARDEVVSIRLANP